MATSKSCISLLLRYAVIGVMVRQAVDHMPAIVAQVVEHWDELDEESRATIQMKVKHAAEQKWHGWTLWEPVRRIGKGGDE